MAPSGSEWQGNLLYLKFFHFFPPGTSESGGQPESGGLRRGGGRGRPPPGLSGREIGLWYAKRSKQKKEEQERKQVVHEYRNDPKFSDR